MSVTEPEARPSRRRDMEAKRASKRPSRAGRPAGESDPQLVLADLGDAGLQQRLKHVIERGRVASSLEEFMFTLITMDGDLSMSAGLSAMDRLDRVAVDLLLRKGREDSLVHGCEPGMAAFLSAVTLDQVGRVVMTTPLHRELPDDAKKLGISGWVTWSKDDLAEFSMRAKFAMKRQRAEVGRSRAFLASLDAEARRQIVNHLRSALLCIPPVQLYYGRDVLTNLRGENNLTGKTLSAESPLCFFTDLDRLPLDLWSDPETVIVTTLWTAYQSGGPHRLEGLNGSQLNLDTLWYNFREIAREYEQAFIPCSPPKLGEKTPDVPRMLEVASALNDCRKELVAHRALAQRVVGATRSKRDFALPALPMMSPEESRVVAELVQIVPGATGCHNLAEIRELLTNNSWLIEPTPDEPTGIETAISTVVRASVNVFEADYALSRGVRDYPALVRAVRTGDFSDVVGWELPSFYCCVVPGANILARYGDEVAVADAAWAMSARMQYNTWHAIPGALPKDPGIPRDFFAPKVLPDVADNMDFFHRGHIVNLVKYTARSPEAVNVAGATLPSLSDLRLVRAEGQPFTPAQLSVVMHISRFIADLLERLAALCGEGCDVVITSFDSAWHREISRKFAS